MSNRISDCQQNPLYKIGMEIDIQLLTHLLQLYTKIYFNTKHNNLTTLAQSNPTRSTPYNPTTKTLNFGSRN